MSAGPDARAPAASRSCACIVALLVASTTPLAASAAVGAAAPPAAGAAVTAATALPDYAVGDAFVYDNGRVEQVAAIDGDRITWSALGSRSYVRHRNFLLPLLAWRTGDSVGLRRVVGAETRPWPLAPGRGARFQVVTEAEIRSRDGRASRPRRSSELWSCRVGDPAPLRVRAGTFDAWELRCDRYSPRTMRVLRRDVWHYAPDVGHYVKRESIEFATGRRTSFELAATLPARDANPRRIRAVLAGL